MAGYFSGLELWEAEARRDLYDKCSAGQLLCVQSHWQSGILTCALLGKDDRALRIENVIFPFLFGISSVRCHSVRCHNAVITFAVMTQNREDSVVSDATRLAAMARALSTRALTHSKKFAVDADAISEELESVSRKVQEMKALVRSSYHT
jgi:hypothetical protein